MDLEVVAWALVLVALGPEAMMFAWNKLSAWWTSR